MNREYLIVFCLFHKFCEPVVFDDGFHPVECREVDNHRLRLVFGIRDIFTGYCSHACIIPVFMRESIRGFLSGKRIITRLIRCSSKSGTGAVVCISRPIQWRMVPDRHLCPQKRSWSSKMSFYVLSNRRSAAG